MPDAYMPNVRGALVCLLLAAAALAQRQSGQLRVQILDAPGVPLDAQVSLVSLTNQVAIAGAAADGRWTAGLLPFGPYRLRIERPGFEAFEEILEVRSEVLIERRVTLGVAPIETQLQVRDANTLLSGQAPGWKHQLGRDTLDRHRAAQPARACFPCAWMSSFEVKHRS
jgi:hypothetical protein